MKKIIIEYYLIRLAIFLMNPVNVRTEQGVELSQKSLERIHACVAKAKVGKNGETLTSTSEILANMDYKSQTCFFDQLFGKMVAATAKESQPWNKCVIKQCLADITGILLDNTNSFCIKKVVMIDITTRSSMIDKAEREQYDFAKKFMNHVLMYGKVSLWKVLNINSFCAALACVGDIVTAGFQHLTGFQNAQISDKSNGRSNDSTQSDLVREYKQHLKDTSDDIKKNNLNINIVKYRYKTAEQFCTQRTCLHELWSVGFKSELKGYENLEIYQYNKNTIYNFKYLSYVKEYIIQLLGKNGWSGPLDPNSFCDLIAINIVY